MSTNAYNCPDAVYQALERGKTAMLQAIARLGPRRVQWAGMPDSKLGGRGASTDWPVAWTLDGIRTTPSVLFGAAGFPMCRMDEDKKYA